MISPSNWPFFLLIEAETNGRHFADDIFKCIFLNENAWILIKISLKFVPKGPINNIPALVQIMAWRRLGDKPLSEPIVVSLPTHICVARPQWVKSLPLNDNTGFCIIIQASKLVFGSILANYTFLSNFEQKMLYPPGWPIVGLAYRRSGPSAAKMKLKRRIRHCPMACG